MPARPCEGPDGESCALILVSTAAGVGLDFVGVNPVKALYWTAVINGLLAPFLLVAILIIADRKSVV